MVKTRRTRKYSSKHVALAKMAQNGKNTSHLKMAQNEKKQTRRTRLTKL